MYRMLLKSKIHRATVTQADLDYVGSLTIDSDLLKAADLVPGELVHVADVNNGARLETYVLEGPGGSGIIGINGPSTHLIQTGDLILIMAFAIVPEREVPNIKPRVVFVDGNNRITALRTPLG